MSYAYAPSTPAELPIFNNLSKSKKIQISHTLSFKSHISHSRISLLNPSVSSNRVITQGKSWIRAFYSPTETTETLYDLLGVKESGTVTDIKKAYKQMARKYHPDVSPNDRVDEYTKRFIMVQSAYETLSDPMSRAEYDRNLGNGSGFSYSGGRRSYHYNNSQETGEWRMRWNSQIDELKQMSISSRRGNKMTWGARMRNQR